MTSRLKADFGLVLCALLWGGTFVMVQSALAQASVFAFLAVRFSLAAAVLAIIYRANLRKLSRADFRAGGQIGVLMFGGYVFQTAGLLYTTSSKTAFITGFGVVLVPIFMAVFWRRPIRPVVAVGALIALAGLYCLTVPLAGMRELNRGDLLVMVCSVLFALHLILIWHYSPQHSLGALSFLQVAATAALSLAALPVLAVTAWEPPRIEFSTEMMVTILATAVLATALAFSVMVWAQRHTSPAHAALILSLEPVFAALTSFFALHERLGLRALAGAALILAGIVVAELKRPPEQVAG